MKAKWFSEVKNLLVSEQFQSWWKDYTRTQIELARMKVRLDELLTQENLMEFRADLAQRNAIDKLYQSTGYEDQANAMQFESSELENRSYESVANFEEKRIFVSDLWFKVGALEHRLESLKSQLDGNRAKAKDAKGRVDLEADVKVLESDSKKIQKEHQKLFAEYEKEAKVKQKLWEEVEGVWTRSLECNLKGAEARIKASKVKGDSERFFADAEVNKKRAQDLSKDVQDTRNQVTMLEKKLEELLESARVKYECIALEDFLYWQQRESNRLVYGVPLFTDNVHYNIEIRALSIYQVERQRGVGFIEPAVPSGKAEHLEDTRLDDFFLADLK
jgi:chromosome segregation ATPase